MKEDNLIQSKSFEFAKSIVRTYKKIISTKKEYELSKQLLKCGTSIGSNVEEAIGAQSRADFIHKLSISYKEARETIFWIKLLTATGYIDKEESTLLLDEAQRICRIMGKIQLTTKSSLR